MRPKHQYDQRVNRACPRRMLALIFVTCGSLTIAGELSAQTVFTMAPEPVGSGARALGQSAFIAVADDATAASWNPAGLVNLEKPEASFVGLWRTMRNDLSCSPATGYSLHGDTWSEWEINFMSYAQPIQVGNSDVVLSVNYHQVYDLGLEYSLDVDSVTEGTTAKGAISAYSLAGGLSLPSYPQITVGGSFNWYVRSLHYDYVRRTRNIRVTTPTYDVPIYEETDEVLDDLRGYNFTLGILWDAWEWQERLLTLGLVCQTPFTAKVDQETVDVTDGVRQPREPMCLDIEFPLSLGAGANYRFSDVFSAAIDVQWTNWSQFGYTAAPSTPSSDALALRLGFEHLWFSQRPRESVWALRGGAFYEPRPAWSDILPVYGFSLGLGWTVKERFSLDFAYQFRWGKEGMEVTGLPLDYEIEEHWLIGSVVTYF